MKDKQIDLQNTEPKYLLHRCPVCNGWGTVSFKKIVCHACKGKGYIPVPAKEREKEYGGFKP